MLRLLYFSKVTGQMSEDTLRAIVEASARRNAAQGITGALVFNGRNFCQVLEGEDAAVRALVARIRQDDRHSDFKIIDAKQVDRRHFPDWSMHQVANHDFHIVIDAMAA